MINIGTVRFEERVQTLKSADPEQGLHSLSSSGSLRCMTLIFKPNCFIFRTDRAVMVCVPSFRTFMVLLWF